MSSDIVAIIPRSSLAALSEVHRTESLSRSTENMRIAQELLYNSKEPGHKDPIANTDSRQALAGSQTQPQLSDVQVDTQPDARRRAARTSNTWTSSSGDVLSDQDEIEDRSVFIQEYNRLAKKHGIREIVPEDDQLFNYDPDSAEKPPSWFSRKIFRQTSSSQSVKQKPERHLKHRRSISDSLRFKLKKDKLKDKDLQELVRLCGSSLLYLPTEYAAGSLSVPTCFRATAQYLVQHAPSTRGVFRIPGSQNAVSSLYSHYCSMDEEGQIIAGTVRCPTLPEHIRCDVHDVASAFKKFLSGLPGGILGSLPLLNAFISIQTQLRGDPELTRTKQSKVRGRLIALAISTLRSQYRRELICAVFGLLSMIGRAAETAPREDDRGRPLPTSDLMGYRPLGIVFGPLLVGDYLGDYSMRLANPHGGLILLPISPPKSRKERNKKGKSGDEGSTFNTHVDKIKVANGITEMLITHWRDVVRHMRSLHALKLVASTQSLAARGAKLPILRPSASETFALRKPPDWENFKSPRSNFDRSVSPTPAQRTNKALEAAGESNGTNLGGTLKVKKQRSKANHKSNQQRLSGVKSMSVLSPTVEESPRDNPLDGENQTNHQHGQSLSSISSCEHVPPPMSAPGPSLPSRKALLSSSGSFSDKENKAPKILTYAAYRSNILEMKEGDRGLNDLERLGNSPGNHSQEMPSWTRDEQGTARIQANSRLNLAEQPPINARYSATQYSGEAFSKYALLDASDQNGELQENPKGQISTSTLATQSQDRITAATPPKKDDLRHGRTQLSHFALKQLSPRKINKLDKTIQKNITTLESKSRTSPGRPETSPNTLKKKSRQEKGSSLSSTKSKSRKQRQSRSTQEVFDDIIDPRNALQNPKVKSKPLDPALREKFQLNPQITLTRASSRETEDGRTRTPRRIGGSEPGLQPPRPRSFSPRRKVSKSLYDDPKRKKNLLAISKPPFSGDPLERVSREEDAASLATLAQALNIMDDNEAGYSQDKNTTTAQVINPDAATTSRNQTSPTKPIDASQRYQTANFGSGDERRGPAYGPATSQSFNSLFHSAEIVGTRAATSSSDKVDGSWRRSTDSDGNGNANTSARSATGSRNLKAKGSPSKISALVAKFNNPNPPPTFNSPRRSPTKSPTKSLKEVQNHIESPREALVAPYTINPPSPVRSHKSGKSSSPLSTRSLGGTQSQMKLEQVQTSTPNQAIPILQNDRAPGRTSSSVDILPTAQRRTPPVDIHFHHLQKSLDGGRQTPGVEQYSVPSLPSLARTYSISKPLESVATPLEAVAQFKITPSAPRAKLSLEETSQSFSNQHAGSSTDDFEKHQTAGLVQRKDLEAVQGTTSTESGDNVSVFDGSSGASKTGRKMPFLELPPVAQHIDHRRPPSRSQSPDMADFVHPQSPFAEVFSMSTPVSPSTSPPPPSRSNSLLYSRVRILQRQISAKNEEIQQLRQQLDAHESLDIGTLSEQLREAKREIQMWIGRAEAAEKQLELLQKLAAHRISPKSGANLIKTSTDSAGELSAVPERIRKATHGLDGTMSSDFGTSEDSSNTVIRDLKGVVITGSDSSQWDRRSTEFGSRGLRCTENMNIM